MAYACHCPEAYKIGRLSVELCAESPTGLVWNPNAGWNRGGRVAGTRWRGGSYVTVNGRLLSCRRLVWELHNGVPVPDGYKVVPTAPRYQHDNNISRLRLEIL